MENYFFLLLPFALVTSMRALVMNEKFANSKSLSFVVAIFSFLFFGKTLTKLSKLPAVRFLISFLSSQPNVSRGPEKTCRRQLYNQECSAQPLFAMPEFWFREIPKWIWMIFFVFDIFPLYSSRTRTTTANIKSFYGISPNPFVVLSCFVIILVRWKIWIFQIVLKLPWGGSMKTLWKFNYPQCSCLLRVYSLDLEQSFDWNSSMPAIDIDGSLSFIVSNSQWKSQHRLYYPCKHCNEVSSLSCSVISPEDRKEEKRLKNKGRNCAALCEKRTRV